MFEIKITITPEEIKSMSDLAMEIWKEHYTPIIGAEQVCYMLERYHSHASIVSQINEEGYIYYTSYINGKPVGYCGIKPEEDTGRIFLSKLYVKKEYRKMGLARQMFSNFLIENGKGYSSVYLTVNKQNVNSIEAYKRLGFVITDSVVTDIGNGYVMDDFIFTYPIGDADDQPGCMGEQSATPTTSPGCMGEQSATPTTSPGCMGEQSASPPTP